MITRLARSAAGAATRWDPRAARRLRRTDSGAARKLRRWDLGAARRLLRTRPEPALVRLGVFAAGVVALLVGTAGPAGAPGPLVAGLLVLAALPAVWPRGPWVTVVVLVAAAGWLAGTGLANLPDRTAPADVPAGRLLVLAAALYLVHSLAALAATLPYDAVVVPDVLARWLLRALGVILVSALFAALLLAGLTGLVEASGGRAYLAVTLAGLAVAVVLVMVLARRVRR